MNGLLEPKIYLALMHYPVVNKNGETIVSAVTNLDLHDIARASETFGVKGFFVVTPLADQQALVKKITEHWTHGKGGVYNPVRQAALNLVHVKDSLADALAEIEAVEKKKAVLLGTSAKKTHRSIEFTELRQMMSDQRPYMLVFGTAWGLSATFMESVDYVLKPIKGAGDYNHLSVRSAVAIILDRLYREI